MVTYITGFALKVGFDSKVHRLMQKSPTILAVARPEDRVFGDPYPAVANLDADPNRVDAVTQGPKSASNSNSYLQHR